jgi:predicted RNA-binding protein
LDQRYWDLECDDGVITLHLEHYLGISVFDDSRATAAAEPSRLLTRAFEALVAFEPRS